MTKRYQNAILYSPSNRHAVEAEFPHAQVTANGSLSLLAEADRRLGLTCAVANSMGGDRRRKNVVHPTLSIVRQRVYALVPRQEDLNDHDALRHDVALQAAVALVRVPERRLRPWPAVQQPRCGARRAALIPP